jgi:cell division protein FtsX
MPASQPRYADALEIAVRDLPLPAEVEHDASVALLRFPCSELGGETDVATDAEAGQVSELPDSDELLLEPSDTIDVDAARSAVFERLDADELEQVADAPFEGAPVEDHDFEDARLEPAQVEDDEFEDAPFEVAPTDPTADSTADIPEAIPDTPATETSEPAPSRVDPIRVPLWSGLNSFAYAVSRGVRGMGQSPLVQLLAVGTMAVCMLLLGTTTLILQNAQRVAHDLGVDTPVTVYMQPDSDALTIGQLRARIAELPEVASVEHVTPEAALARLEDGLGQGDSIAAVGGAERAELLAGIDASNLPDSLEIALVPGVDPGFADALATRIGGMAGVDEVSALGPWVQEVERMLATLRWLAIGIGVLVSLACLAIVWNTIRLGVFARRAEIDILRLVGGTSRFVRGPFVVEGVVQGVLGTALAIAGLWLGFELIRPFLERGMALVFAAGSLRFFSMIELGLALAFGAMIGLIGSRAAVAHHA